MNNSFWIRNVTVGGHVSKPDSTVTFTPGLNVIYGQSDAGKTWVLQSIDYVFGAQAKDFEIKPQYGYTFVSLEVETPRGSVKLIRWIGEDQNTVNVESNVSGIDSGDYKVNSTSKRTAKLSDLLLRLIGYEHPESMFLPKNTKLERQKFTWRTFWHFFYANEVRICDKKPIFSPTAGSAITPSRCALVSLLTGKDYSELIQKETFEEKERANAAIIHYLENRQPQVRSNLNNARRILDEFSQIQDIEQYIKSLNEDITQLEEQIGKLVSRGQDLSQNLSHKDEQIAEDSVLLKKYGELRQSYQARIDRIDFITQGLELLQDFDATELCPVCSQPLPEHLCEETPEQNQNEKEELQVRLSDLISTMQNVSEEMNRLGEEREQIAQELGHINEQLANDLQPRLTRLNSSVQQALDHSANRAKIEHLEQELYELEEDLEHRRSLTFPKPEVNPLKDLGSDFWTLFENIIFETLTACGFRNLTNVRLNRTDFDAIINGKEKSSFGKGYRSFINTVMMLSLREYMAQHSVYNPGIVLIDTPLLGLDDLRADDANQLIDAIPLALYDYMAERQDYGQMIVADNTKFMPTISKISKPCNLIEFTKRTDKGRFGFILESTDKDFTNEENSNA